MPLDEPFAGIDPITVIEIQRIITYLKDRGIGVLISDHNVQETLAITDRAYILYDGRILASGTATELANNSKAREIYLGEKFCPMKLQQRMEPAGRHDPAAPAGDPAPAALHPRAGAGGAQGARGESAPRGGAGRERGEPGEPGGLRLQLHPGVRADSGDHLGARAGLEGDILGRQREGRRPAVRPVLRGLRRPRRRADAGVHGGAGRAALREPRPQRHVAGRAPDGAAPARGTDDKDVLRIGEAIIGNLDEDGYLRADVGEIAAGMGTSPEAVEAALKLIHGFDPPGVAARSVQECLLLQLTADAEPDPVSVEIVERYFEDLERRRYAEIARALKLPPERVMESIEEIQSLEPKPGRRFSINDSRYVVPDVTIQKVGDDYVVILNEEGIPRLRVNSLYRSLLRRSGDEAKQYVEQKLRSAVWLIKSVEQRQRTLRKVAQSLVNFQRDFLDKGLAHLRPLALRDVGDDISMHESTISRVTTNKYVQTPQGLFELKFFFHSGIASENGSMVSSVSVKKTIRDMVAGEDGAKPLSDQGIAQSLQGQGLTIARRTVAKYREELGIMPSHQRRLSSKKR